MAQGRCIQLLRAIRIAPLHSQTGARSGRRGVGEGQPRMLRQGERDSWSDGSACVAVIYILGAINGTAVTVSGEPAGGARHGRASRAHCPPPDRRPYSRLTVCSWLAERSLCRAGHHLAERCPFQQGVERRA